MSHPEKGMRGKIASGNPKEQKIVDRIIDIIKDKDFSPQTKEAQEQPKRKRQFNVYHNTVLLLKKYRDLKWAIEQDLVSRTDLPPDNIDLIIDKLRDDLEVREDRVMENRLQEIVKTKRLLSILDGAVSCLKYHHDHGEDKYNVIFYTYICMNSSIVNLTSSGLFLKCNLSQATYYRIKREAITNISSILWQTSGAAYRLFIELWDVIENVGK